jgi:glycosyltransferase involved in cell wall biosynthesis
LPIYNKAQYLSRSIGSIQIQTLKDIEIIPVNDCSNDKSLEILEKMKEKDRRINIVNNNKNKGLLYSRAVGILHSKGEYLMNLDPDDRLEGPDNLKYLYRKAKREKVDLVNFGLIISNNSNLIKYINCGYFDKKITQPQIYELAKENNDYLITNKLVKKEIFLKAYQQIQLQINSIKWNYAEDEIWSSFVNKHANSMICVNKMIFIYYSNNDSLMNNRNNYDLYFSNMINYLEMFTKIFHNKNDLKYLKLKICVIIKILSSKENLLRIRNNTEIKEK